MKGAGCSVESLSFLTVIPAMRHFADVWDATLASAETLHESSASETRTAKCADEYRLRTSRGRCPIALAVAYAMTTGIRMVPLRSSSGVVMRISVLFVAVSAALCGVAHAGGSFIGLQTPNVQITKLSGNGKYAVGSIAGAAGFRWNANTGAEELITDLNAATGINNSGTIAGSVPQDGGSANGGRDLGAYAAVGSSPILLTGQLQDDATGYDISDDGTVVGLSFGDGFVGPAVAFAWTAAENMVALPVNRPQNYSRANVISADGHVIAGWNDQDNGFRTAVIWADRVPWDVVDPLGNPVGEADGVSNDGQFVVGESYTDPNGQSGAWIWNAKAGLQVIPGMTFAFGVSNDGKTVVGSTGFFDDPPRAAMIWRDGFGTVTAAQYLAEQGIAIPAGWDTTLSGGFGGISGDGSVLAGWTFGPLGEQSYIIEKWCSHPTVSTGSQCPGASFSASR
jgi:hypothetical protein